MNTEIEIKVLDIDSEEVAGSSPVAPAKQVKTVLKMFLANKICLHGSVVQAFLVSGAVLLFNFSGYSQGIGSCASPIIIYFNE